MAPSCAIWRLPTVSDITHGSPAFPLIELHLESQLQGTKTGAFGFVTRITVGADPDMPNRCPADGGQHGRSEQQDP
jgi:hypothetical protein